MGFGIFLFFVSMIVWELYRQNEKSNTKPPNEEPAASEQTNKPIPKITFTVGYADDQERQRTPSKSRARQPGPCTLTLFYIDMAGQLTKRDVAPYKSGATNDHFDAYCTLRNDRRTFFFDGIDHGIDLATGEIISSDDIFKIIHPKRVLP